VYPLGQRLIGQTGIVLQLIEDASIEVVQSVQRHDCAYKG
jgi:hypothetical protein